MCSRRGVLSVKDRCKEMAISLKRNDTLVIIPVLNEEASIEMVLDELDRKNKDVDILVVDDGSVDRSKEKIEKRDVFLLNHSFNMGIGASFGTGCQFAMEKGYDYIVRMDGDGQHDSAFIKTLLAPVKNNEVDITVGSRFLGNSGFKSSFFRLIGISIICWFLKTVTKRKITDPTSGFCAMNKKAYKFFSRNCADDYPEPEILLYHREFRIREIPVSISKRYNGISSITPLKSAYYMFKVLFSLFVHVFRKEAR